VPEGTPGSVKKASHGSLGTSKKLRRISLALQWHTDPSFHPIHTHSIVMLRCRRMRTSRSKEGEEKKKIKRGTFLAY
jgi:hypothetical protein